MSYTQLLVGFNKKKNFEDDTGSSAGFGISMVGRHCRPQLLHYFIFNFLVLVKSYFQQCLFIITILESQSKQRIHETLAMNLKD